MPLADLSSASLANRISYFVKDKESISQDATKKRLFGNWALGWLALPHAN
ncbi:hypothetical protein [Candidatus Nitrospira salsa]